MSTLLIQGDTVLSFPNEGSAAAYIRNWRDWWGREGLAGHSWSCPGLVEQHGGRVLGDALPVHTVRNAADALVLLRGAR